MPQQCCQLFPCPRLGGGARQRSGALVQNSYDTRYTTRYAMVTLSDAELSPLAHSGLNNRSACCVWISVPVTKDTG
ncbi:MAG: hypothetical protein GPOALKHO_001297 [Sodalis sp.]|nr:MAG: hypothetical protein GPOALKHO_001297 [Sodalis sp.]